MKRRPGREDYSKGNRKSPQEKKGEERRGKRRKRARARGFGGGCIFKEEKLLRVQERKSRERGGNLIKKK